MTEKKVKPAKEEKPVEKPQQKKQPQLSLNAKLREAQELMVGLITMGMQYLAVDTRIINEAEAKTIMYVCNSARNVLKNVADWTPNKAEKEIYTQYDHLLNELVDALPDLKFPEPTVNIEKQVESVAKVDIVPPPPPPPPMPQQTQQMPPPPPPPPAK